MVWSISLKCIHTLTSLTRIHTILLSMPSHLTIRNLPEDVARELEAEKRRRGESMNRTVIEILRSALALGPDRRFDNGLARLAGTWSAQELEEFEAATACFEQIDADLWS